MLRVLLALSILCSPLSAGQCNVATVRSNVVYNKAAIVSHAYTYAAPVVALQQVQPYTYWTVGQSVQEAAQLAIFRKVVREEIRQEFKALQLRSTPVDPEQQKSLGLQVLEQSCMKCHQPGSKAVTDLQAPVFFDENGVFNASAEVRGSIGTVVKKGIMPPAPAEPLDDDSYLAIKQFLQAWNAPPVTSPRPNDDARRKRANGKYADSN